MAVKVALYDANVLYPFYLRDLLVRLALTDLFQAKWTVEIQDEWIRNLSESEGIPLKKLARTRRLMDDAVLDCLVSGYSERIQKLQLPDPDDRHVLAAAIECGAGVIVTANLDDFPQVYLDQFGIEATHPDGFVLALLEEAPDQVLQAMREQRADYKDPALSAEDLIAALEKCGLEKAGTTLRNKYMDKL